RGAGRSAGMGHSLDRSFCYGPPDRSFYLGVTVDLTDKTALVTGATSGIGRAIALELARDGATVIVSGRDAARGADTVAAIEAEGGSARFVAADPGDLQSVAAPAEESQEADCLANNAGIFAFGPTADQDVDSFEAMFDVNVRGPYFLTAALA